MKKSGGVDSSVYFFVGGVLLLGIMVFAIRWVIQPSCPEDVYFDVKALDPEFDGRLFENETITFWTDVDGNKYLWDFGDDLIKKGSNVMHSFAEPGTYKVKLTINDECSSEREVEILAGDERDRLRKIEDERAEPQTSAMIEAPSTAEFGSSVQFSEVSGNATSWQWSFGDGGRSTEQNPSYTFSTVQTYTVRVFVDGGEIAATHQIEIVPKKEKVRKETKKGKSQNSGGGNKGGGAVSKPKPVQKEIDVSKKLFMKMLNELAADEIRVKDFKKYLDTENGFGLSSKITVDGDPQNLSTFLSGIGVSATNNVTDIKIKESPKGYIRGLTITTE